VTTSASDQAIAQNASDQATTQARFAAREFVARFARDTGTDLSAVIMDRMLFAYEIGYLRGRSDGTQEAMLMFDAMTKFNELAVCKESEDDDDAK
jgi:hypothetical protein